MISRHWRIAVLVPLLSAGCRIGPPYQRPVATVPTELKEMAGNDDWKMATPSDNLPKGKWWEVFGDPQLSALEELVDVNNQNIKQAEAEFRQARAVVAANHANYYPTIGTSPSITQSDRGEEFGQSVWNQPDLLAARGRNVGAGSLGPGSFVGRERRAQRTSQRGRPRECQAQRTGARCDRLLFARSVGHAANGIARYDRRLSKRT